MQQLKDQLTGNMDQYRAKILADQVSTLSNLVTVLDLRCKAAPRDCTPSPESSSEKSGAEQLFSTGLDDVEVLYCLFREADRDKNGCISKDELIFMMQMDEHKVMTKVLLQAWECSRGDLMEALAHLEATDFGNYRKVKAHGQADDIFDLAASVEAVFDAAIKHRVSNTAGGTAAGEISVASRSDIEQLIAEEQAKCDTSSTVMISALKELVQSMQRDGGELDFLDFMAAMRKIPRVAAQRLEWVGEMGLNAAMARHLPPGTLTDGLKGLKTMSDADLDAFQESALSAFFADVRHIFKAAVKEVREAKGSTSAVEANSKFTDGFFQGSFASIRDFHAGAEETLRLGYPNPDIEKGIRQEHTSHPSDTGLYVTPNYRIATCLLVEYWWAMYEEFLEGTELEGVRDKAMRWIMEHGAARVQSSASAIGNKGQVLFPGEVGDSFVESLVIITVEIALGAAAAVDSHKAKVELLTEALRTEATARLATDEEKARGAVLLDHAECAAWMAVRARVLAAEPSSASGRAESESPGSPRAPLLIGVVLPMSQLRAQESCEALRGAVAASVGASVTTACVKCCKTWTYCTFAGVEVLQKRLDELSLYELRDKARSVWKIAEDLSTATHADLCGRITEVFVRSDLQADFAASLDNADEQQLDAILQEWGHDSVETAGRQLPKRSLAIQALVSEKRWRRVERWVGLFRGRIQGRTRLGRRKLIEREQEKILLYRLTKGEVLALHIYTGPGFVPINAICRNFCRQNSLAILHGNTLITTLFCVSSGIKKLGQHTLLPANRRVFRGLGTMVLPQQFWVPHSTPPWLGGVERAFMSTTADKSVAMFYANGRGTVAEISVGRIQIGGDVSFLSMVR